MLWPGFYIQHFPERLELVTLLNVCSEVKAWGVAAEICRRRFLYPQAFYYHLQEAARTQEHKEQLQESVASLAQYFFR